MTGAAETLTELSRRGVTIRVEGDNLRLGPRAALDDGLLARIREHKGEIIRLLAARKGGEGEVRSILPTRRCRACNSWLFWVSVYGAVACATCHPPASRSLVKSWYWLPQGEPKKTQ
jgi:hypothetical protein